MTKAELAALVGVVALLLTLPSSAQNHAPNPYVADATWAEAPPGRLFGASGAVYPARDGTGNVWVAERCGVNACSDRADIDPIVLYSPEGKVLRSFGAGIFLWPHGIFVDHDDNVWITDARGDGERGHQIHKFSSTGERLQSLGIAGVGGLGEKIFNAPSDVVVSADGTIFVADGHNIDGNNRIVKLAPDGSFLAAWGATGGENGQLRDPHALAMDSHGRLFVGDRRNKRVQIFDQDGTHLASWYQFGGPSGLFIDDNDMLYVCDNESSDTRTDGFLRGIRIGSVTNGRVIAFIPDPEIDADGSPTEGVAADAAGNVYGAEVGKGRLVRYGPAARAASDAPFSNPEPVAVRARPPGVAGAGLSIEEPFVSRDGRRLFFNSGEKEGNKDLHYVAILSANPVELWRGAGRATLLAGEVGDQPRRGEAGDRHRAELVRRARTPRPHRLRVKAER